MEASQRTAESPVGAAYRRAPGTSARSDDRGRSAGHGCKSAARVSRLESSRSCGPRDHPLTERTATDSRGGANDRREAEYLRAVGNFPRRSSAKGPVRGSFGQHRRDKAKDRPGPVRGVHNERRVGAVRHLLDRDPRHTGHDVRDVPFARAGHRHEHRAVRARTIGRHPQEGRSVTSRRLPWPAVQMSIDTSAHSWIRVNSSSFAVHRSGGISTRVTKQLPSRPVLASPIPPGPSPRILISTTRPLRPPCRRSRPCRGEAARDRGAPTGDARPDGRRPRGRRGSR